MCRLWAPWCLSSLPRPVPGETQPASPGEDPTWGRRALAGCARERVGWWDHLFCEFRGSWSRALSLGGEGSFRKAISSPRVLLLLRSQLSLLPFSIFLFSLRSNFVIFHYCKAAHAYNKNIGCVDKKQKKLAPHPLCAKDSHGDTVEESSRSLSRRLLSYT